MRVRGLVLTMLAVCLSLSSGSAAMAQYGTILAGAGPINQSMGGAATAAPLSANGAMMWNPASLAGLNSSQLDFGATLLVPRTDLFSSYPANFLGSGAPAMAGSTSSGQDVFALPNVSLSYRPQQSNFTYGLGILAPAGFGTNYSASNFPGGNPVLSPPPPNGLGLGSIYSSYQVMQIVPALVWHVDDNWAVSAGPTLDIGRLQVDPGFVVPANGPLNWPQATHTTAAWGAGYQASLFYQSEVWNFGFSYKSQQFFQPYQIDTTTATGGPKSSAFTLNLPAITSVGAAYKGIDRWLLSTDVRYLDYQSASGFGNSGYGPAPGFNVQGVGFQNIFAVATGAQYQLTDAIALRAGYSWNQNPISGNQVTANVASPLIIQHMLSCGATMQVNRSLLLSAAYSHGFQNSISGPLVAPGVGAIPGTSLTSSAYVDMFMFGATVLFGG